MKGFLLAITLLGSLVLGSRNVQAYDPYWDAIHYQQYLEYQHYLAYLQQYDPYHELHVMHYELYLQPYYAHQLYQPCCYVLGVPIVGRRAPIVTLPRAVSGARSQTVVRPAPRAVTPLPPAVTPLGRAVTPLPRATGKR
jgi:hypothetical protein